MEQNIVFHIFSENNVRTENVLLWRRQLCCFEDEMSFSIFISADELKVSKAVMGFVWQVSESLCVAFAESSVGPYAWCFSGMHLPHTRHSPRSQPNSSIRKLIPQNKFDIVKFSSFRGRKAFSRYFLWHLFSRKSEIINFSAYNWIMHTAASLYRHVGCTISIMRSMWSSHTARPLRVISPDSRVERRENWSSGRLHENFSLGGVYLIVTREIMFTQKYDALLSDEHEKKGFRFVLLGKQLSHCLQPRRFSWILNFRAWCVYSLSSN